MEGCERQVNGGRHVLQRTGPLPRSDDRKHPLCKRQINDIETKIDGLLNRAPDASNAAVIRKIEDGIGEQGREKTLLTEKLADQD